jgi:hypothetical protein
MFLATFHPTNISKIRGFTSGCSKPSIFKEFKACKFLFNNQFSRNISIRIIFAIKRWYFKLEFMKRVIIVAYLTSSMAIPPWQLCYTRRRASWSSCSKSAEYSSQLSSTCSSQLLLLLCPWCQSCSHVTRSSKRLNRAARLLSIRATDASIVPSLVSVASCVASNTPILSFVTYTSASIPSVCFFTSHTKAGTIPFERGDCGGVCSSSSVRPTMVRSTKQRRKQVRKNKKA